MRILIFALLFSLALFPSKESQAMPFEIKSPTFENEKPIPVYCTCDGEERSPALAWSGAPQGTKSYALIVDDPDAPDPAAPKRTYVHWVLYNLPKEATSLAEGIQTLPEGAHYGKQDGGGESFVGPCPPIGTHRYFHKLYALDTLLNFKTPPTKREVEEAMEGHILAQATLMGTYKRP